MPEITFKKFMEELDFLLLNFNEEDLKHYIKTKAKSLPSDKRPSFLLELESIVDDQSDNNFANTTAHEGDQKIIDEVDNFIKSIENEIYYHGWGWDHDIYDERVFGDCNWIVEFNEFLSIADNKFRSGYYQIATELYQKLLFILQLSNEGMYLPDEDYCEIKLDIDYPEFIAKYIRSVYLTTDYHQFPERLLEIYNDEWYVSRYFAIKHLVEIETKELPNFDLFLENLHNLLKIGEIYYSLDLHIEVIYYIGGIEKLEEFSLEKGKTHPQIYIELLSYISKNEEESIKEDKLISIAKKALKDVSINLVIRSTFADYLYEIGQSRNDDELIMKGLVEGYLSDATITRFLRLYQYSKKLENFSFQRIIERTETLVKHRTSYNYNELRKSSAKKKLLSQVYILTGELSKAYELCKDEKALGWSSSENSLEFFLPFLIKLLSDRTERSFLDDLMMSPFESDEISDYINEIIIQTDLNQDELECYLSFSHDTVSNHVETIVSNQYRNSYHIAAKLLVGLSWIYDTLGYSDKGNDIITYFRKKFNRHRSFQQELDAIL